jgi:hypothetical protein
MADITIAKEDVILVVAKCRVSSNGAIPKGQAVYLTSEIPRKQKLFNIIRWCFRRKLITKSATPIYAHEDIRTPIGMYAGDGKVYINPHDQLIREDYD